MRRGLIEKDSFMKSNQIRFFTRREFITRGLGIVAVATTIPSFLARAAFAVEGSANAPLLGVNRDGKVLVVIQLSGGNDGLNTVIPFSHDAYYRARPSLAVAKENVLRVTDDIGLHPNLAPLKELYDAGKLAVIQGVGYPNPDRSHFRSMEIWQSGITDGFETTGWIGRMFDHTCNNTHLNPDSRSAVGSGETRGLLGSPTLGVSIDEILNPALNCNCSVGVALRDPEQFYRMTRVSARAEKSKEGGTPSTVASQIDFLRRTAMNAEVSADRIRRSVRSVQTKTDYPKEPFAQGMKLIAAMIAGGMDTRVYYISLGGFDTHANQQGAHERLLKTLAEGIGAFQKDLEALGQAERVLGFTFSEFGRRVAENGSRGTDHGQAAPMFVFGKTVKPGVIGPHPSLEDLNGGDLKFKTDFRQVYATALEKWMEVDSSKILSQKFDPLPFVA